MGQEFRNPYDREAATFADEGEKETLEKDDEQVEENTPKDEVRDIEIKEEEQAQDPKEEMTQAEAPNENEPAESPEVSKFEGEATFPGGIFSGNSSEVEAIKAEMEELRLRQAAEMDNFKKRLNREHQEQLQYSAEKVLKDLLPTLDNLELALQYGTTNEACKDLLQGVAMTHKLLLDAVQKHGLKPVGEVGEAFNPAIHEAVGVDNNPDVAPNCVSKVLQKGYTMGNRLVRAAKVMISPS